MKLHNTLTGKLEEIKISSTGTSKVKGKRLKMFVCGPTIYDHSHIGHARTYIFFDTLVRYMKYLKLNPFYLMNITDIDDKMIARAKQLDMSEKNLAKIHEKSFFDDMKSLKITSVTKYARATDFITEIVSQIQRLVKSGVAYQTGTGVYFDITKFKDYGKLSKQPLKELKVHRIEPDPTKRNMADFSLWKAAKQGEPSWESPWGKGRPGWHIEDTAIAMSFFGEQYDLHGGGIDLIFPHHEAEIAQAEALTGKKPYVRHWIHSSHLVVDGRKMSKSLGNFITIKEILKDYEPELLRILFLQSHYRKTLDYSKETIATAKRSHERLKTFQDRLAEISKKGKTYSKGVRIILGKERKKILNALNDDFDTSKAFTILLTLVKKINLMIDEKKLGPKNVDELKKFLKELDTIFGILPVERKLKVSKDVKELMQEREKARKDRDFMKADQIRDSLKKKGIVIVDTPKGPIARPI